MATPLRVLVLEDRAADAELMLAELRRAGFDPAGERVETEADCLASLDPALDLILADYALPGFDAARALALLQGHGLDIPFVVVSGAISEEVGVECMKAGAADYLLKDRLARLGPAVRGALDQRALREARRRAEAALRESEERYRLITENIRDAVFSLDLEGHLILWNRRAEELVGVPLAELSGRPVFELFAVEGAREARARLEAVRAGREVPPLLETELVRPDGRRVWVEWNFTSVEKAGQVVGRLGVARDVTERKQAMAAEARLQAHLAQSEKLAAMGQLLAGVAHELNNPLSVVLGQATLLHHTAGPGPLTTRAEKIAVAAERCARIVRNFLALARQHPPERRSVPLNRVVQEAVELLAYPLRVDSVKVTLDLAPDLPALWADPHQLHQVVVNLVTNAHQAMRETPPPRRLTLTTRFDGAAGRVALAVADTGPGIAPEIQARILEPFFTTKPLGQGTGLGLSLCLGIVEGHGGTIRVESRPGAGAVFRVELPVGAPGPAPTEPAEAAAPAESRTILVVDDEAEVAAVLAELLEQDGHRVETVDHGAQALARLGERRYDLIFSDMKMPELDGPALYREVGRRDPALQRRFVFLTGDTLTRETAAFLGATRAPTLSKPFDLAQVRRAVREAPHPGP